MKMLKKYYKDVCQKRQEVLKEMYSENYAISYRWQDIVEEAKKSKNRIAG